MPLTFLPTRDTARMAAARQAELDLPAKLAAALGRSAMEAATRGHYRFGRDTRVDWSHYVKAALRGKKSIPPDGKLLKPRPKEFTETRVLVTNETTLGVARRLVESGVEPLALNFANGVQPGGGFLSGARAQEETLCRSSALFQTLVNDRMYEEHRQRPLPDSTDWAIYSPNVPVFRTDDGAELETPYLLSFITCAAPFAPEVGQPASANMLRQRIHRVLAIARAYGYSNLVLGAWGCGAFANDPHRTATDFRHALEHDFSGAFAEIVFAITDWSAERKFLGPFRDVFSG